jgi:recombination protein RecT
MSKIQQALAPAGSAREPTAYERFRNQVEKLRSEIAALVGKDNVDRFLRVCMNAVQANPDVLQMQARKSLLLACMRAAQDRLLPDGREAVFNVYKVRKDLPGGGKEFVPTVQYLPMVGGLIKKLYDSGNAIMVDAVAVRERDYFKYSRGDDPRIDHDPYVGSDDPGEVIAAYVIVKLKNGETKREVMSRREIEQIREKSKSPTGLMWKEFFDQAAIKSVIKRAYKQLPSSYELDVVIASDNASDAGLATLAPSHADRAYAAQSADLERIIDGTLDQELRTVPAGTGTVKETVETEPSKVVEAAKEAASAPLSSGLPAGTPEIKAKLIVKIESTTDSETAALVMDEANLHDWSDEDRESINRAYLAHQAKLAG